jgi:hypothetical protein
VTPYVVRREDGQVDAVIPARCPEASTGEECHVTVHHRRTRKCGPGFALVVAKCQRHPRGGAFTLYPPAWAPYRRQPLAPATPAGHAVHEVPDRAAATRGTIFEAAHDAAQGDAWPSVSADVRAGVRRTQRRHISYAATLLGLVSDLSVPTWSLVAEALRVPELSLREAAAGYRRGNSVRARAQAVMQAYALLHPSRGGLDLDALLRAGWRAGLWGRPKRWDPGGAEACGRLHLPE